MARKLIQETPKTIETIVEECLKRIGISDFSEGQIALLTRLIFSGVSYYFFKKPDSIIDMGYIQFRKNPDKEELFAINIKTGDLVKNAETLWRYYTGELQSEKELKNILADFANELIAYSQLQQLKINKTINKVNREPRKEK